MPIGYLVTTLLLLLCTLPALAPFRRPWPLAALSFRLGFLPNELPFVAFYWLLASTVLAVVQGVHSPGGWLVFGLAAVTTAVIAVVALRGLRAAPVLDRALSDGLGSGWRDAIDPGMSARFARRLPYARILFGPLLMRRPDVERVSNVRYGQAPGAANLLDVYRHRSRPTGCPVLVHLHGGALVSGRKSREARPLLYRLASQGWVCVSANYRLSPAARFPDHLVDTKKVIAWVREHAHEFGGDPETLIISGSSAGGQLASLAALTPNDRAFQPGFEQADTSVSAVISLYGFYGHGLVDSRHRAPYAPLAYPGNEAPPFLVVHGDQDTVLLVEGARLFTERLRTMSSQPVVYAELPGGQHAFDLFHSLRMESVVDGVEAFAAWVHSTRAGTREDAQEA